jgi:hypothetical protein
LLEPNGEQLGPFFHYSWGESDPVFTWTGKDMLTVTVAHVSSIETELPQFGDTTIIYRIGSVS